ncbi:MAG: NADH-quinone oxidoreductase subunit NuoG [Desulfobacterales bacterium]
MPKLIIDNRKIDAAPGTKVIEAAEKLGIMIPRFCWHPALGSAGACRVCAVKFTDGPVKGIQMSCMVEARDGMVISTADAEVMDFRKHVIELLMLNHPHDCPVCDEGGQCLLQDMTVSGGHGLRRFKGRKRTHVDQYLGPLLQHEMNRCIQCYRCVRYYREITGYRDLGVTGIGSRVYFGRQTDGILESPFSGNLSDICPTGVFTDKPSRFKGRHWDFEQSPGLCLHCSLGCHTTASVRYREIMRQEARFSESVNGHFICDRGRYGFYYANSGQRPRIGRVNGKNVSSDEALKTAVEQLEKISKTAVACAGSARSSLETLRVLQQICKSKNWKGPAFFSNDIAEKNVRNAVSQFGSDIAVSLQDMGKADFILVTGVDPLNDAPMLTLTLRQAQKSGATVLILDPRPIFLPFDFVPVPIKSEFLPFYLGELIRKSIDPQTAEIAGEKAAAFYNAIPDGSSCISAEHSHLLKKMADSLQKSQRPVIISGTETVTPELPALTANFVRFLQSVKKQAGLFYVMPGANSFGAAVVSDSACSFDQIVTAIEQDKIKALLLMETDPFHFYPDRKRLETALDKLELLIVMDYLDSSSARRADIFVPVQTVFESGGTFVNAEGRMQRMPKSFKCGIPVAEAGKGNHPPRAFRQDIPGSDLKTANEIFSAFSAKVSAELQFMAGIPENVPEDGIRVNLYPTDCFSFNWPSALPKEEQGFRLLLTDRIFGTEELSLHSSCLQELEETPCLHMQSEDALSCGFSDHDLLEITAEGGTLQIPLKTCANMASGVLVLPKSRQICWQIFGSGKIRIQADQLSKI